MDYKRWSKSYKKFKIDNLVKGHEYYIEKKVINYKPKADGIFVGTVKGSNNEIYDIELNLKEFHKSTCSCSFGKKGNKCKHLAALYFELYGDEWYDDYVLPISEEEKTMLFDAMDDYVLDKIEKFISLLKKDEVKDLLQYYLYNDKEFVRHLLEDFEDDIAAIAGN